LAIQNIAKIKKELMDNQLFSLINQNSSPALANVPLSHLSYIPTGFEFFELGYIFGCIAI